MTTSSNPTARAVDGTTGVGGGSTVKTPDEIRAEIMRPRRPGPESNAHIDALEWVLGATYDGDGYWSDGYVDLAEQARLDAEVDAERTDHAEQTTKTETP